MTLPYCSPFYAARTFGSYIFIHSLLIHGDMFSGLLARMRLLCLEWYQLLLPACLNGSIKHVLDGVLVLEAKVYEFLRGEAHSSNSFVYPFEPTRITLFQYHHSYEGEHKTSYLPEWHR